MQGNDEKNSPPNSGSSSSNSGSDGILGPRVVYMLRELGIHMDETHLHAVALDALSNLPADWQIMYEYGLHSHQTNQTTTTIFVFNTLE